MKIRRVSFILFLAVLVPLLLSLPARAQFRIGFKLYGGYNYLVGGEGNDGVQGFQDFWVRSGELGGYSASGDYKPFHYGFTGGGDLIFYLTPNIGVSIGAGYLQASSSSVVNMTRPGVSLAISSDPKAGAVPLRVGLHLSLPIGASANFVVNGGAGYYLGTFESRLRLEEGTDWMQWEFEARGQGIGFHGGAGFELNFGPNVGLVLEAAGRYARIGGFEGEAKYSMPGFSDSESGKLYFYRMNVALIGTFPMVFISDTPPSGSGVSDVHEAKIDFSGFSARAGLIIRF
ncbi:MAG: outer membrane beta-barrel protein [Candidatus Aminicenantes bacterium]|nr:outer membrane beta-barrel protein [Candidatus Aminicenantes bacterium]